MEILRIPVAGLLIDTDNPRIEEIHLDQQEALRAIAAHQKAKLTALAQDIVEHGTDPSNLPVVMPSPVNDDEYIVLEGNRRIAALKILENPDLIAGAVDNALFERFKKLSEQYLISTIDMITCVVVDARAEANHWIFLRHTGENKGAGIVRWGGAETARFRQRGGKKELHLQVLDFLEGRGEIEAEVRKKVPVTSLKRLLSSPYVRTKLGIDSSNGNLVTRLDDDEVAKGLRRMVKDLADGTIRTKDIYTKEDRIRYIDTLSPNDLPDTSKVVGGFRTLGAALPTQPEGIPSTRPTRRGKPSGKQRSNLIPRGIVLSIGQSRINDIYYELRRLDLELFCNAVSVLFRVFLELSLDFYIEKNQLSTSQMESLSKKLLDVANHLREGDRLNEQQLKPVRRAAQQDSFQASTITTMHQYVHNPYFFPGPSDLRAAWDSLQPFVEAVWQQ
jgi:hypothetical protein